MRIWTPSDRSASWVIDDIKQSGSDWRALGSSVRSMWNRRAPDVARDPARLKKLADERLSAVAPQIAAPTLAALPQALDSLSAALRNLPDVLGDVPATIETIQRRRRPPLWRRQGPLFAVLGIGLLGGILAGIWVATSTTAVNTIRGSVRQARRRLANDDSEGSTTKPIDRTVTGYSSGGDGYTDADMTPTPPNGMPAGIPATGSAATAGRPSSAEAARDRTDQIADVDNANTESWVPVGPESAATRPEVTERAIRG